MDKDDRKAAVAAYKERKILAGIYALRCAASGECWVGRAANLATIQNQLWFALRHGSSPFRALQAAWQAHGADALTFEVLEAIPAAEVEPLREAVLRARQQAWRERLGAFVL